METTREVIVAEIMQILDDWKPPKHTRLCYCYELMRIFDLHDKLKELEAK